MFLVMNLKEIYEVLEFLIINFMILCFLGVDFEDVMEFLVNFKRVVCFYKFLEECKVEVFLLYLIGNVSIWFNIMLVLVYKIFDELLEVLRK